MFLTVSEGLDKDPTLNSDAENTIIYQVFNKRSDLIWAYEVKNTEDVISESCTHEEIRVTNFNNNDFLEFNIFYKKNNGGDDPSVHYYYFKEGEVSLMLYEYEYLNEGDVSLGINEQLNNLPQDYRDHMIKNWNSFFKQRR